MKKKIVEKLRSLYVQRKLEFVVLYILSTIKDGKFISKRYIADTLGLKGLTQDIMLVLSRLSREKLVENHSLMQYRVKQKDHDKWIVDRNYELLHSLKVVPDGRQYSLGEAELEAARKKTPAKTKKKLNWIDGVETKGKTKLMEFIAASVIGPIGIVGSSPTQSVFRITENGLAKLKLYEQQHGKV